MILRFSPFALGTLIISSHLCRGIAPSDIPGDTPISQLVSSANANLAAGNAQDALTYFDIAVSRAPDDYLTIFKRGATYLSLGKTVQAQQDFDKVLAIKPHFEGALLQRAKIRSRNGDWAAARKDFEAVGRSAMSEMAELEEAQAAAVLAAEAENRGDWEECVAQASAAIVVAGTALELRKMRARCRFENGDVEQGVSDLQHVLHISSGSTEPHLQSSAMTFYSLGETEKGLSYIRKCLHSDPDSKPCKKMLKREKEVDKALKKVKELMKKRQFQPATKVLLESEQEPGLLKSVKEDVVEYKKQGYMHKNCVNGLYTELVELTCQSYIEMNNRKKAAAFCNEALKLNPSSFYGLLAKAATQIEDGDYEPALHTLNEAKQHHGPHDELAKLRSKAEKLLRQSKQKDYYKVLGVDRDADERDIKRAYRKLTLKYHPDKASQQGLTKEESEKKMAAVNEAYEVLSDPELKARFDRGDDPNDPQQGNPFQGSPFGHGPSGQPVFFRQGGFPGGEFKFHAGGFQFPQGFGFP